MQQHTDTNTEHREYAGASLTSTTRGENVQQHTDNATMASTTTLTALPAEMLAAVAEQAEPRDLLALRLACRDVSAAAFESFIKAFFTKRSHLYTSYGLQSLLDISAQPHLMKRIEEIEIVSVRPRDVADRVRYLVLRSTGPEFRTTPKIEQSGVEVRRRWTQEDVELREKSKDSLMKIFSSLRGLGVAPDVTVSIGVEMAVHCFGFASLRRSLGPLVEDFDFGEGDHWHLVPAVLTSIAMTRYPLQRLALCKGARDRGLTQESFGRCASLPVLVSAPLASLSSLTLHIDVDTFYSVSGKAARDITSLFSRATMLKDITAIATILSPDVVVEGDALDQLTKGFATNALNSIKLCYFSTVVRSYTDFLENFRASIKNLTLVDNCVDYDECWSTVFVWLAENVELEVLHMRGLRKAYGRLLLHDRKPVDCVFEGAAAVREGLHLMAQAPEYQDQDVSEDGSEDEDP
ncbi:hypothetical protein LTR85_005926 [Meristemomyces frigidus]|nr:hypothetical protein LTR85_005926 [Meristemomyces frigidus]